MMTKLISGLFYIGPLLFAYGFLWPLTTQVIQALSNTLARWIDPALGRIHRCRCLGQLRTNQRELVLSTAELSTLSDAELMKLERDVAARHVGRFPYFAVFWAFSNLACWLALWPLVFLGYLPIWAGFILATINITLSYLPSHEAQHDIIARPGEKLRWLNQLVGHTSTIPLVLPYRVAKLTHMEHHKHANHSELDPDYSVHAPTAMKALLKGIRDRQPRAKGGLNAYGETLKRLGRTDVILDAVAYEIIYFGILFACAWNGFAIEAALLWWLPRHIALSYIRHYLSWAPHHPSDGDGPLPRHAQLPRGPWQYRLARDAISCRASSASAHPALPNTACLLGDARNHRSARCRRQQIVSTLRARYI